MTSAPLGYTNVKDTLRRPTLELGDAKAVKAIRRFFDEFATGKYLQNDAAKVAETCGIRARNGKPLSRTGAIGLLNSVVYAGKVKNSMTDNREVDGLHPAIISIEQFKAVQAILAGRRQSYAKPARFKSLWPLKRFLVCGQCGHPLTGSSSTGSTGKKHPAYHCPKCTIKRTGSRVAIPKAKAHDDFADRLDNLMPSEWAVTAFREIVLRRWDKDFRDVQDKRREIDDELTKLEEKRNKLFDMHLEGRLPGDKQKKDEHFNQQIQRLEVRQQELEMQRDDMKSLEVDRRQIVNEAVHFIAHAGDIWRNAKSEHKVLFQKLVYEGGLALYPNQTFGTAEPSIIYQQLTEIEKSFQTTKAELPKESSALVHPEGFEPPTLCSEDRCSNPLSYGCVITGAIIARPGTTCRLVRRARIS